MTESSIFSEEVEKTVKLTPMRYKDYVWPNNPETYRISFRRTVAAHKLPGGNYAMQDLGTGWRVLEGEGEFAGADAYEQFKRLATVFYQKGAGVLVHPVWMTTRAYFVELEVMQEPTPDYVRYRFAFWEDFQSETALKKDEPSRTLARAARTVARYCIVAQGDTLWAIAARYNITMEELLKNNPQIKNPNLIRPGERVRLS